MQCADYLCLSYIKNIKNIKHIKKTILMLNIKDVFKGYSS